MKPSRRYFLKQSVVLGIGIFTQQVLSASRGYAETIKKSLVWKNWSGNVTFKPDQIFYPQSIEQVQNVILSSKNVRVAGAAHSFSALVPGKNLISSRHFKHIQIDAAKFTVTAGAGVTLSELNAALVKADFALPDR